MKRFFLHPFSLLIGGALLAFLCIVGFNRYNGWREKNRSEWKTKYEARGDSIAALKQIGTRDSIIYRDKIVPEYIRIREAAKANPTPENVGKVIRACDLVVSACDSIQGNLRGQIRNLEAQNDLLRHKPGPPRLIAYGEADYDAVGVRPVFRVGAQLKTIGPLYLKVEGEYAIPSNIKTDVGDGLRVLAGVRINFNR